MDKNHFPPIRRTIDPYSSVAGRRGGDEQRNMVSMRVDPEM
jgi:hypothetical protein